MAKVFRYLFFIFLINHFVIHASEIALEYEPMGAPHAPLGAVWVENLEESLKTYHKDMLSTELHYTTSTMKSGHEKNTQTNFALFELNIKNKDGNMMPILDRSAEIFSSGGKMLVHAEPVEFKDMSVKKGYENSIRQFDTSLKVTTDPAKIERISSQRNQLKKELRQLEEVRAAYLSPFADLFRGDSGNQHETAMYDPEQTITRIVDHHIRNSVIDDTHIMINGKSVEKEHVDCFVLNLHSRTDMCPFCCMFLAHHLQVWRTHIHPIPFVAVVTSRQEYRCPYVFMIQQPYYQGYSMRSFGWQPAGEGTSFEGVKAIADQGLVVQYAFEPGEIYK